MITSPDRDFHCSKNTNSALKLFRNTEDLKVKEASITDLWETKFLLERKSEFFFVVEFLSVLLRHLLYEKLIHQVSKCPLSRALATYSIKC